MDEIKVDGDVIADAVGYLNGLGTKPAKRMADAVLRLLNRHYQDAAALEAAREDAAGWRQAFVSERARHNRERGMSIEQARIHAETDAEIAAIDQARGKGGPEAGQGGGDHG